MERPRWPHRLYRRADAGSPPETAVVIPEQVTDTEFGRAIAEILARVHDTLEERAHHQRREIDRAGDPEQRIYLTGSADALQAVILQHNQTVVEVFCALADRYHDR
ncbi:hypothetical protein ACFY4C_40390 [Actinomadura viridis]|uniref:hypothetical protein n=1 Tax=Actinomadura viridis TaxID=58110 RepID=UPI003676B5A1